MARLKIRKLVRENEVLNGRLNDTMAMLALVAHREGGELSFSQDDFKGLPEAAFSVKKEKNGGISLVLKYNETPPAEETPVEESPIP